MIVRADSDSFLAGTFDELPGKATINPFDPQASSGDFIGMAPGSSAAFAVTARQAHANEVPVKGWLVVTFDDRTGPAEADLVPLPT